MRGILGIHPGWGITPLRVVMALSLVIAGYTKMSIGMPAVAASFARYPIPFAWIAAPLIAVLELVGGLLLLVGYWSRILGLFFVCAFIVAAFWLKFRLLCWLDAACVRLILAAA